MAKAWKFTTARKKRYLDGLRKTGTVGGGCKRAGITRVTVMHHREKDPEFAEAEQQAKLDHCELHIEAEIHRRAIVGYLEPVHYQGKVCDKVRRFSDQLLLAYAKRHIAEYRDRASLDVNVQGGVLVVGGEQDAEVWARTKAARPKAAGPGD